MRIQGYRREGERKQEISQVSFLQAKNLRKVTPGSGNTKLGCRVMKGPVMEGEGGRFSGLGCRDRRRAWRMEFGEALGLRGKGLSAGR